MIDGKNTKMYDGFVRIVYSNYERGTTAKTICLVAQGTEDDQVISLDDCLEIIGYEKNNGVVYVTFDNARRGTIYQYGNYPDGQWHKYGTTNGYA